jgi:hypothetical protein
LQSSFNARTIINTVPLPGLDIPPSAPHLMPID